MFQTPYFTANRDIREGLSSIFVNSSNKDNKQTVLTV